MSNIDETIMELKDFGRRIYLAREHLNMSQYDLADALNRDQQAISGYERGTRKFPIHELPLLADALKVPITYFFEDHITPDQLASLELDDAIVQEIQRLTDTEAKQTLLEIIRLYVRQVTPLT